MELVKLQDVKNMKVGDEVVTVYTERGNIELKLPKEFMEAPTKSLTDLNNTVRVFRRIVLMEYLSNFNGEYLYLGENILDTLEKYAIDRINNLVSDESNLDRIYSNCFEYKIFDMKIREYRYESGNIRVIPTCSYKRFADYFSTRVGLVRKYLGRTFYSDERRKDE